MRLIRFTRAVALLAGLAAAGSIVAVAGSAQAAPPAAKVWSLNSDVAVDPVDNPIGDAYGDAGVWSYLGGAGVDPSTYYSLDTYTDSACGTPGLYSHSAPASVPLVSFNATTTEYPCGGIHFPIGKVNVHPSPSDDAIVAWTSPITGRVDIAGDLADNDAGGGDGITYAIVQDGATLAAGGFGNGGSTTFPSLTDVPVTAGDTIYLHVGPGGNYTYDSTGVDLTITQDIATLTGAAPKNVVAGGQTVVTLRGTHFAPSAQPVLDDPSGITLGDVTVQPTAIVVAVTVDPAAAPGPRKWSVLDPSRANKITCKTCTLTVDAAPTLDGVAPSTVPHGATTTITLTGTGFLPRMRVSISGAGITRSAVTVVSSTKATLDVTVAPNVHPSGPNNKRSISVVNTDGGAAALPGALAIS